MRERENRGFWSNTILAGFAMGMGLFAVFLWTTFAGLNNTMANVASLAVIVAGQLVFGKRYAHAAGEEGITYGRSLAFMATGVLFAAILYMMAQIALLKYVISPPLPCDPIASAMIDLRVLSNGINSSLLGMLAGIFTSVFIYKRK